MSAYTSSPARGEYCVSKAGVGMMTALYADRLAEHGIGVFEIRPGHHRHRHDRRGQGQVRQADRRGPDAYPALGAAGGRGRAVGAIAEGRLDFSTGQVINVDGGFHLRRL